MKVLIIAFFIIIATIDFIIICGPAIRKYINERTKKITRKKNRKAFTKKMKELEIK